MEATWGRLKLTQARQHFVKARLKFTQAHNLTQTQDLRLKEVKNKLKSLRTVHELSLGAGGPQHIKCCK